MARWRASDELRPCRLLGIGLLAASLPACAPLPRGGPSGWQILHAGDEPGLMLQVVPLTAAVAAAIDAPDRPRLRPALVEAAEENAALIGPGDILALTIWESVEDGLFASGGRRATTLESLPVDESGAIFVPYVGHVRDAGQTVRSLRDIVRRGLEPHTLSPEVDVRRIEQRSRAVSVQGLVGRQGIYPIEAQSARLLPMLATAGGAQGDPGQIEVVLRRDGVSASASLDEIFARPELDVALRQGDTILVRPI